MAQIMLTSKQQAAGINQARADAKTGNFMEYKPSLKDRLSNLVFSTIMSVTGDQFSGLREAEEQELYDKARTKD